MIDNLQLDERETSLSMMGDNHGSWEVFSDDPYWIRRLDEVAEVIEQIGAGKRYRLDANQVTVRAKPKPLSDERKAQLATRLAQARKTPMRLGVSGVKSPVMEGV